MPKNVYAWIDALEHWSRRDPGGDITININSPPLSRLFTGLWRDRHHENDGARRLIRHKLRVLVGLLREQKA